MARKQGQFIENQFNKGLITEATGLTYPEDGCAEAWDVIFNKTGEVTRRKGFEYETDYSVFSLTAARADSALRT